jgi:hypothetical protein
MAAISLCGLATATYAAQPQTFSVDCAKGQTISAALDKGDERKPMVLTVQGTCNENVAITRDDVTLQGDPKLGATINGSSAAATISVSASRVRIDRFNVRGGAHGIFLQGGSSVDILNSDIQYSQGGGFAINGTSSVTISNCNVQHNPLSGVGVFSGANVSIISTQIASNSGNGVRVTDSVVQLTGSNINSNGVNASAPARHGIFATSSRLRIVGGSIGTNAGSGVYLQLSSAIITGTTITGNGTDGSLIENLRRGVSALQSIVQITNSTIASNSGNGVAVEVGSSLNLSSASVTGNGGNGVMLYLAAVGNFAGNVNVNGNAGSGLLMMVNSTAQLADGSLSFQNIWLGQSSSLWVYPEFGTPIAVPGGVGCADGKSSVNSNSRFSGPVSCSAY